MQILYTHQLEFTWEEGVIRESRRKPVFPIVYPLGQWNGITIGSILAFDPILIITRFEGGEGALIKLVDIRNVPRRFVSMDDHHVLTSISASGE
jgi:hypothetical protein